jgi:hypothetical protein
MGILSIPYLYDGPCEESVAVRLTSYEEQLFSEARKGNWDPFTEYYFQLPFSGTMYTTEDRADRYEMIYDAWLALDKPENEFFIEIDRQPAKFVVMRDNYYEPYPIFLLPHGFRLLDWIKPLIDPVCSRGLAETGAGTGKTANVAIAALSCCAVYPGFRFLNAAPTSKQAGLMLAEIEKWCLNTKFRELIVPSRGANPLWTYKSGHPIISIEVVGGYASTFVCQTTGREGKGILGDEQDWINVDEAVLIEQIQSMRPILTTRLRGTRSTGHLRWGKNTWITNPGRNVEFDLMKEEYEKLEKEDSRDTVVLTGIDSSVNIYVTRRQLDKQRAVMDSRTQGRWIGGDASYVSEFSDLGDEVIEQCLDMELDQMVRQDPKAEIDDLFGITRYEIPYIPGHQYLIVGDVGRSNLETMTSMNVPCIMVFDVTHFLERPSPLVAFHWWSGNGSYRSFASTIRRLVVKYRAMAYYDATHVQSMMEDFDDIFGDLPMTEPVFFSGTIKPKRWALAVTIKMCQDGMFSWPRIKGLWHQARIFDVSTKKQSDDIIATLLVFALALQYEGALYHKLVDKYRLYEEQERDEITIDEVLLAGESEGVSAMSSDRYSRTII